MRALCVQQCLDRPDRIGTHSAFVHSMCNNHDYRRVQAVVVRVVAVLRLVHVHVWPRDGMAELYILCRSTNGERKTTNVGEGSRW